MPPGAARPRSTDLSGADYRALSDFRYEIRRFLHFSEEAAKAAGLEPQQHQLLLAVCGYDDTQEPTIGSLAERMLIRHHSAVGLIDRMEARGLVARIHSGKDRREVRVRLTAEGREKLRHLSSLHRQELRRTGPVLVRVLGTLLEGIPHKPE